MNIQLAERIQYAVAVIYPDIQQSAGVQRQAPTEATVWYEFSRCVLSSQVPFSLAQAAADKIDEVAFYRVLTQGPDQTLNMI